MKNFLKTLSAWATSFFSGIAQVRAASAAARMHRYQEAAELMAKK